MSLFVVQHQHPAETCPAGHPEMGPMLVKHLSARSAETFGVKVLADAVLDAEHTCNPILEADSEEKVKALIAPFYQAGSVEIWPASSCEQAVDRAEC